MNRRGQAAMEYMSTYGWAMLIIAIVGVVLWQFGIFDFQTKLAPGFSGFSILMPLEWVAIESGGACTLQLVLMNGAGEELNSITVAGGSACNSSSISPGGQTLCSMDMGVCASSGRAYETEITITYQRSFDNMSFQTSGELWGNID